MPTVPRPGQQALSAVAQENEAFDQALTAGDLTTIVAKVEAVGPSGYVTDLALLENRFEFAKWLKPR